MSRTKINVGAVMDAMHQITAAKTSVSSAKSAFTQTRNSIDGKIQNRSNIRNRLTTVQNQLSGIDSQIGKIRATVQSGANQYKNTDDRVNRDGDRLDNKLRPGSGNGGGIFSRYFDDDDFREMLRNAKKKLRERFDIPDQCPDVVLEYILELSEDKIKFSSALSVVLMGKEAFSLFGVESESVLDIFGSATYKAYLLKVNSENGALSVGNHSGEIKASLESSGDFDKINDKLGKYKEKAEKFLEDKGLRDEEKETKYYKDGKEIKDTDVEFYDRQASILEMKAEGQAKVSWIEKEYEFLGGTGTVTVAEAEAHAGITAGLYVIGNDGERLLSPGVSAEIGASATAFHADYQNQILGNEMIGLNADAEVTALAASAKASVDVNFLGKDDKGNVVFDPQVNAGVEAEAVLVEAEGSIGVNVLGGEASVKGSVKVGIGAHADVGIKDGVVKCEIGASLGVGFDVGFEVDVGGMVNTVADAAQSAWEGITSWWS